ncbi:hypothetical protein U1Q18_036110 [Sarracenia purpurea var. burkii]
MEKQICKLCFKSFANGRALGGHMRSHMVNLQVPPKEEQLHLRVDQLGGNEKKESKENLYYRVDYCGDDQLSKEKESEHYYHRVDHDQLGEVREFASLSSDDDEGDEDGEEDKGLLSYGLRENPKKSIRLVDPEFTFAVDAGSVVLQDRESETESSKNPVRRRSKRIRKSEFSEHHQHHQQRRRLHHDHYHQCRGGENSKGTVTKKPRSGKLGEELPWAAEPEPVSSISDTSPEEDVAYCLMMLSRDKWMIDEEEEDQEEEEEEEPEPEPEPEEDDQSHEFEKFKSSKSRARGKYKCDSCHKVFRSYQALGGHRASHKKARAHNNGGFSTHEPPVEPEPRIAGTPEEKIHECPVCYRVFASGQALGGHKRSHGTGSSATATATAGVAPAKPPLKSGQPLIDLNLPAPADDDDVSQIELSAVSDAEFVDAMKN